MPELLDLPEAKQTVLRTGAGKEPRKNTEAILKTQ